jgi:hypothetical protein
VTTLSAYPIDVVIRGTIPGRHRRPRAKITVGQLGNALLALAAAALILATGAQYVSTQAPATVTNEWTSGVLVEPGSAPGAAQAAQRFAAACAGSPARLRRLEVRQHVGYATFTWHAWRDIGLYSVRELHGLYVPLGHDGAAWRPMAEESHGCPKLIRDDH